MMVTSAIARRNSLALSRLSETVDDFEDDESDNGLENGIDFE